jgi:hypothetical protein
MAPKRLETEPAQPGQPADQRCELCGHWSVATEYGIDSRSGYCDRWEKITRLSFWCDEFVSQGEYDRYQQELAEQNEQMMDED